MDSTPFPLRKMSAVPERPVRYSLSTSSGGLDLTAAVGGGLRIRATGRLSCVACGRVVPKFYGQGFCFPCLQKAPEASECIVRPELCRAHVGEGRDADWEREHHLAEHTVYLSHTGKVKVGVTRSTQVPVRWIDQGAVAALAVARTPYRQLAGQLEVALKRHLSDRTDWRAMLRPVPPAPEALLELRGTLATLLPEELQQWLVVDADPVVIDYPVGTYPAKVSSVQLARSPEVAGRLAGIKGQYLIWEDGRVLNVRNHAGYHVEVELFSA